MKRAYLPAVVAAAYAALVSACGYGPVPEEKPDASAKPAATSKAGTLRENTPTDWEWTTTMTVGVTVNPVHMSWTATNTSYPANDANKMITFSVPAGTRQGITNAYSLIAQPVQGFWPGVIGENETTYTSMGNPVPGEGGERKFEVDYTNPNWGYRNVIAEADAEPPLDQFIPVLTRVPVIPIRYDDDRDGDVDADDVASFEACATGPAIPYDSGSITTNGNLCKMFDYDLDNDIDQSDFGGLQKCLSGPGVIATNCEMDAAALVPYNGVYPPGPE